MSRNLAVVLGLSMFGTLASCGSSNNSNGTTDEVLIAGTTASVTWSPLGASDGVDLSAVDDDGSETIIASAVADSGSYQWQVPLLTPGQSYTVVAHKHGQSGSGQSCGGDHGHAGALVSFSWNTSTLAEDYSWIDPITGDTHQLGTVGDLMLWSGASSLAFDPSSKRIYVTGSPTMTGGSDKVYTLDSETGALSTSAALDGTTPDALAVDSSGTLIGFSVDSSGINVVSIDTDSGHITTLSSLAAPNRGWFPQVAIDRSAGKAYLASVPTSGNTTQESLYTIDLSTDSLSSTVVVTAPGSTQINALQVASDGSLIGSSIDNQVASTWRIDPSTGDATMLAQFNNIEGLSDEESAIDPSGHTYFMYGQDTSGANQLLATRIADGTTSTLTVAPSFNLVPTIVY